MPTLRLCGGTVRPVAESCTTRSPIAMRPTFGVSKPATHRIVLVFPQPDCPSKTSDSPSATSRSRSRTTVFPS